MLFYVIYQFDLAKSEPVRLYEPPFHNEVFRLTEKGESDYGEGYNHRKYAGLINKEEFLSLIDCGELRMQDIDTMGSVTELGLLPAFSFRNENTGGGYCGNYDCNTSAYVCPLKDDGTVYDTRDWERLKKAILAQFSPL